MQCPKSVITAESVYYLETFRWWKQLGGGCLWSMDAKAADAILLLEQLWEAENKNGES